MESTQMMDEATKFDADRERWLNTIVSLPEGAALRGTSVDTLRRLGKAGELEIVKLSPQRRGIRRREALKSIEPNTAA
jgi:hypothetical protein